MSKAPKWYWLHTTNNDLTEMVGALSVSQTDTMKFLAFEQYTKSKIGIGKPARSQVHQEYYAAYIWTMVDEVCFIACVRSYYYNPSSILVVDICIRHK